MTYTKETHNHLKFLRKQVANVRLQWSEIVPAAVIDAIVKNGKYSYRLSGDIMEMRNQAEQILQKETGSSNAWDAISSYASELGDAIKDIRRARKHKKSYSPLADAKKMSQRGLSDVVRNAFQRSHAHTSVGSEVGIDVEDGGNKWNIKNYVTVGATWYRSVFLHGFSLINAPSGLRLVIQCKYRQVKYVDEDNMNAWEVRTIGFKHGKGFEESGWLVTHKSTQHDECHPLVDSVSRETQTPHAFGKNLSKAHSLMKQRTVRHLTKMLDG